MTTKPTVAEIIATQFGASVREIAQPVASAAVVVLADGRMPLLVRDYGHTLSICLSEGRSWSGRGTQISEQTLGEVIAATQAWAESSPAEIATLYAIALELAEALSEALGQHWTVSLPGVPEPREAWLRGPEFDAASVGVFVGRAIVWIGGTSREFMIGSRRELERCRERVVAAVREQLAAYRANVAVSELIRARADELAARLSERLAVECRVESWSRPTHERAIEARVLDRAIELARVFARDAQVRVHAGLVGDDGFEGSADQLEAIVAAIELARKTLTIGRLTPGHRYRVLQDIGELREGMIVRFVGFDDIDNHYGIYEFAGPDDCKLGVPGDYSTPRNSPLAQTHRYLEAID
ncbi:MAG TPA: hypothetical protein VK034_11510 [Enhygromyxa sp.]|nr:hypothetical protein [Enhygromyxa sp.]